MSVSTKFISAVLILVVTIDGVEASNSTRFVAPDAAPFSGFGYSVSIDKDTIIVGAAGAGLAGAAYIIDASSKSFSFQIEPADGSAHDQFGSAVAIDDGRVVVGALRSNPLGDDSGAAYIFDLATQMQIAKLIASDGAAGDVFGASVGISGDRVVVGAPIDSAIRNGSGSAYIYDAESGRELVQLAPSGGTDGMSFGYSVSIDGNIAVVGAPYDSALGSSSGSAYLFDVTTGEELRKLVAEDGNAGDEFGSSVAISGNIAVVGAHGHDGIGTSGAAYLFDVATGSQIAKLTVSNEVYPDVLGISVDIEGHLVAVGALDSGSAYVFNSRNGAMLARVMTPSDLFNAGIADGFGDAVGISAGKLIVGAHLVDDNGTNAGAAYMFVIPEPSTLAMAGWALLPLPRARRRVRLAIGMAS